MDARGGDKRNGIAIPRGPVGESPWARIARFRTLRTALDVMITEETPTAIAASREAGVKTEELADMWGVTPTWIYRTVPVRDRPE